MASIVRGYPSTSDRSRGWLRYLYRKATTPDNWDKDGEPHAHWDNVTGPPTASWHRMDLRGSYGAIPLMADRTPAWREVYGRILDELIIRFTGYWAANDWLDQIGEDPRREEYPEAWYKNLIPPFLRGKYDVPGWCANGVEPWGLQIHAMLRWRQWFEAIRQRRIVPGAGSATSIARRPRRTTGTRTASRTLTGTTLPVHQRHRGIAWI